MSVGFVVFLAGLFGVPIALLAVGHRLRRRSPRVRAMFWGGIVGHCAAAILAVVWGMIPPDAWQPTETARGLAGLWSLLLLPLAGAAAGVFAVTSRRRMTMGVVAAAVTLPFDGAVEAQSLVGVLGHWSQVSDGGPALLGDGPRWSGGDKAFPLAVWSDTTSFSQGTIRVEFKMVGGASDQNAGIVLGLRPSGEYHFVRYNTKDGNIAVWRFADGVRTVIAHGETHAQLPLNVWHTLTVTVSGNRVTGAVAGQSLSIEHVLEQPLAGRVGVWTKRDAITAFRNFRIAR